MPTFNAERAAMILAEAVLYGDTATSQKWSISLRSLERWRSRSQQDEVLAAFVQKKLEKLQNGWADEAPLALREGIAFLRRAAREGDPKSPDQVKAIAGAVQMLAEITTMKQVIDARFSAQAASAASKGY